MIAYEDILEARDNLHPDIIRTPLQDWRHAGAITARQVRLKLETLQLLVVEAAGAVSATAVLFCSDDVCRGRRIAAILSGANITMESFTETLRSHPNVPGPGHP